MSRKKRILFIRGCFRFDKMMGSQTKHFFWMVAVLYFCWMFLDVLDAFGCFWMFSNSKNVVFVVFL